MQFGRKAFLPLGIACAGLLLALAGCKQVPDLPAVVSPYKIDVQQGNVITQEMLSKLKAGMTRSQVRFVLGSPLVVDPFRLDRWDYVSMYQKQGKEVERRRVTVIFDDDKLIRIEGDVTLADTTLSPENAPDKAPPKAAPAEPVKPVPAVKPAAAAAPAPAKTEAVRPPVAAVPKAEQVKPAAVPAEKIESPAPVPKESVADAPAAEAAKGSAPTAAADEKKAEPAKKDAPKEKPKPGFFGRMLDKLGI